MKFVYFDNYFDNLDPIAKFKSPCGESTIPPVFVTEEGVTFFMANPEWQKNERLKFVANLQMHLKQKYQQGLDAFIVAPSDAIEPWNLMELKKSMSDTHLLFPVVALGGKNTADADFTLAMTYPMSGLVKNLLLSVLRTDPEDRKEPAAGWLSLKEDLMRVREKAALGVSTIVLGLEPRITRGVSPHQHLVAWGDPKP